MKAIVGGQLKDDEGHKLFLLYQEGNWVGLYEGGPYAIIGNPGQRKAILNRVVNENITMRQALKSGYLSFDSTRVGSNDVDFCIDVVLYKKNSFGITENRYEFDELEMIYRLWNQKLKTALDEVPQAWMEKSFKNL